MGDALELLTLWAARGVCSAEPTYYSMDDLLPAGGSMRIGVVREIKADEYRVALMPVGAELLTRAGHEVLVETQAGIGSGFADDAYVQAGATIVASAAEIWQTADLIIKVKEPQAEEYAHLRRGQVLFTYFHFAASRALTQACLDAGIVAVAYETIRDSAGRLPLLTPMSEIAGKMSIQEGARHLEKPMMGRGILLGGVPGVAPAHVLVLGGGVVGTNAAKVAAGLGADVVILDVNLERLRYLADVMPANVHTVFSDAHTLREQLALADLVIGAVLTPGERAPKLVTAMDLKQMKSGSVIVDVAIDQGGCVETSHPTTHRDPTFIVDGVVHYCVTNIPGAVGRTSTIALCNATLPYAMKLAGSGYLATAGTDAGLARGISMIEGQLVDPAVGRAFNLPTVPLNRV